MAISYIHMRISSMIMLYSKQFFAYLKSNALISDLSWEYRLWGQEYEGIFAKYPNFDFL